MATVQKVKASAVVNLLRHNERTIRSPANRDIDFQRSPENYSLAPDRGISSYDYFKERKEQLYCYNRSDVNVMAGWVVTAPADLPEQEKERFFQATYNFLETRYRKENGGTGSQERSGCQREYFKDGCLEDVRRSRRNL